MNLSTLYKKLTNRKYTFGYKFILSLFVGLIGISSFCSAGTYTYDTHIDLGTINSPSVLFPLIQVPFDGALNIGNYSINCIISNFSGGNSPLFNGLQYRVLRYNYNGSSVGLSSSYCYGQSSNILSTGFPCDLNSFIVGLYDNNGASRWSNSSFDLSCTFVGDTIKNSVSCTPQYTSEECQNVYGLVSSGTLNTCENNYNNCQTDLNSCQNNTSGFNDLLNNCSNNLNACNNSLTSCLQQNCPETVTGTNRSSLFINNIQYPGAPTIKFTIPEEIQRDQYTDEEETNIDVVGYGYDQDKMQQMVNTQYYKPTAEEMSGLMEKVADFLPLVAIALLITRLRRVIKKIF